MWIKARVLNMTFSNTRTQVNIFSFRHEEYLLTIRACRRIRRTSKIFQLINVKNFRKCILFSHVITKRSSARKDRSSILKHSLPTLVSDYSEKHCLNFLTNKRKKHGLFLIILSLGSIKRYNCLI